VFSGLVCLAVGVGSIATVREGLETGQVYSVGVVFNYNEMIHKSTSPVYYWIMMGIFGVGCVGGIGLGVFVPISTVRAFVKRLAREKIALRKKPS
jgi:hypothetical protein